MKKSCFEVCIVLVDFPLLILLDLDTVQDSQVCVGFWPHIFCSSLSFFTVGSVRCFSHRLPLSCLVSI
jgi:hypothetical protein